MAATAPKCNITVFTPPPGPVSPTGLRQIPLNATLEQVIKIVNDNMSPKTQQQNFNELLKNDIARGTGSQTGGFSSQPSQVSKAAQKEVSRLNFVETAIVRTRVRVYNPEDRSQYIIDNRVVALVMRDQRTGATWTFKDPNAADPKA